MAPDVVQPPAFRRRRLVRASVYSDINLSPPAPIMPFSHRTLLYNTALVHANPARGQIQFVEIAVIVRDHHDRAPGPHQFGQQFVIELAPEFGVLFRRPFVQQQDRALLEQADDQRQPPALAAGQIECAKLAVGISPVLSSGGIAPAAGRPRRGRGSGDAVEPAEQMIIEENRRHQVAILIASAVVDAYSIEVISPELGG